MKQPDRRIDGQVTVKVDQRQLIGRRGRGDVQGVERPHGIAHQFAAAQPARIYRLQAAIHLREGDVQVMAVHRQICRQRRRGSLLHEFRVERTAHAHGREAVAIRQLRQCQRRLGQPVRAQSGNDIHHRRPARLQPVGELQMPAGRWNQRGPGRAPIRKFRVLEGEENRLDGFQRGRVGPALHLIIRHPVRPRKGPGILDLRIRIRLGLAEAHVLIHRVGHVVIHVRIGEIRIRAEISQRIVYVQAVGGDIEERICGRVGRQPHRIPLVARTKNRQHDEACRLPAPLAECLAEIRI